MVVSWYVWHQTKKLSCLGPLSCRVACCRVVSHMCELSLMDQFTHMQHDLVWSSRQKAAAKKIALEVILSCVAATVSRKLLQKKTVSIGIFP